MRWLKPARHLAGTLLFGLLAGPLAAEEALSVAADGSPLRIPVLGLETLGQTDQLAVELDGYDISALVERQDGELVLNLGGALSEGVHALQVLVFYADGNVATLYETSLQAGAGAVPAEQGQASAGGGADPAVPAEQGLSSTARHSFSALLSNSYRAAEKDGDDYAGSSRQTSNGGLTYRGEGAAPGSEWRWQAELDTLYDSQAQYSPTGNEWEMANYRLAAQQGHGAGQRSLSLGNYAVLRDDLLFGAYQRRGVTLGFGNSLESPWQLDIFALQSEPLTDIERRLGYPDSGAERTAGGLLTFSPLSEAPERLQFSAGFVDGESTDSGTAWLSPDQQTRYGGQSWNFAVDSRLGQNSVWLHGDYAHARFDSDGLGQGEGAQSDTAHDLQAQLNSGEWFGPGPLDQWSLTVQRREVGLDFFTLGNLSLPGDLRLERMNWQGYVGNLQLDAELARETNNLDQQDEIADQTADRQQINLYYYPAVDAQALPWRWLGTPALNAGWSQTVRRQDESDALQVGYDLDDRTREQVAGVSFYQGRWNWSVQHTQQQTDDRSQPVEQNGFVVYEPPSDQQNRFTTLQVGFLPFDSLSLSTSWQWNKQQVTDENSVYRSVSKGIDLAWEIVPQRWRLNGSYYRGRDQSDMGDDLFMGDSLLQQSASLQLTWTARQPQGLDPGLDVFVKTSYAQQDSQLFDQADEDWQLLVGFDLRWDTHNY